MQERFFKNNWYVITGGPCCGKTTTVNMLAARGYKTTIEEARHYLDTQMANGATPDEIERHHRHFQIEVLKMQMEQERRLSTEDVVFLDRAVPDALAYYRFLGLKVDRFVESAVKACWYRKVFILENLPLVHDYARRENVNAQIRLSELITQVYSELGLDIVRVPVMFPEDRVQFILRHLN